MDEPNNATPSTLPVCRVALSMPAATPERDLCLKERSFLAADLMAQKINSRRLAALTGGQAAMFPKIAKAQ